jgi:MFS family permease
VLAAGAVSAAGSALTALAVPWLVLQRTGSPARMGVVAACAIVPAVASALAGGVITDRAGSRAASAAADLLAGAAVTGVPVLAAAGLLRFWVICVLMAVAGLCQAPGQTARAALLPALAGRAGVPLGRAAGWYDSAARCAGVLGAAAGGALIAVLGASQVLWADGASFAVSAVLVAAGTAGLPEARRRAGRAAMTLRGCGRDLAAGGRFVLATRLLLAMGLLGAAVQFCDQGWSAVLLPADVRGRLGGPGDLGILEALFSLGALAGALAYSVAGPRLRRRRPLLVLAYLVVGAPRFAVAAWTRSPAPLAVVMAAEGVAAGMISPLLATVTLGMVPAALRARVLAAMTALSLAVAPAGTLAAGWLAGRAGLTPALLAGGGVYAVLTLCLAVFPVWRQLDRPAAEPGGPAAGRAIAG